MSAAKVPGGWAFPSFKGNLYVVSDAEPKLIEKIPLAEGVEGGWAPGGYGLAAFSEKDGVLFVSMHPGAKEGSHKTLSKEIWAFDLKAKKLLSRSPAEGLATIAVSTDADPVLVGLTEDFRLIRYTADPKAGFKLTQTTEAKTTGFAMLAAVPQ